MPKFVWSKTYQKKNAKPIKWENLLTDVNSIKSFHLRNLNEIQSINGID